MNFWHYLFGRRVRMWSPRDFRDVAEAINKGTGSPFSLIHHGVAGDVHRGVVRLEWSFPLLGNLLQPRFKGRLSHTQDGTVLNALYGAGLVQRIVFFLWYGLISLFMLAGLSAWQASGKFEAATGVFVIVSVLAILPLALYFLLNWNADKHYAAILTLLEREAGLQVVDI